MGNDRVKVELVGLLPEFYRICTKCQPVDYLLLGGTDYISEQMADYPPEVLEEQKKLFDLYQRLTHDFAGAVVPVPVNLLSLRGLWLSLRYKLGKRGAVVIGGKRVLTADLPYEVIREAIKEERN
jgi:hypothetical protein